MTDDDEDDNDDDDNDNDEDDQSWKESEKDQFRFYRDMNGDGRLDHQEVKHWIMPDDYDNSEAETKHLMLEADEDKVGLAPHATSLVAILFVLKLNIGAIQIYKNTNLVSLKMLQFICRIFKLTRF